jgi:hypothetical protein
MATNPLDAQYGPEKASTATITAFPSPTPCQPLRAFWVVLRGLKWRASSR